MSWTAEPAARKYHRGSLNALARPGESMDPTGESTVNGMNRTAAFRGESPLTISKRWGMMKMAANQVTPRKTAFLKIESVFERPSHYHRTYSNIAIQTRFWKNRQGKTGSTRLSFRVTRRSHRVKKIHSRPARTRTVMVKADRQANS